MVHSGAEWRPGASDTAFHRDGDVWNEIVDAQGGMDGPEKKEKKNNKPVFWKCIRQSRRTIALSPLTLSIIGSNELSILKWGCRTETDLARLREAEGDERTYYI